MKLLTFSDLIPLALPGFGNAWIFMAYHFLPMPIIWITGIGGTGDVGESKGRQRNIGPWIPWIALYLLSIFTPLRTGSLWFRAGIPSVIIGLALYTSVNYSFLKSRAGERIITGGLYRFSRHPMYVTGAIFLAGMCLVTASVPFLLLSLIVTIRPFRSAGAEEVYCTLKHGEEYRRYVSRTPRWIGVPGKNKR